MGDTAREAADFLGGVAERLRDPQPKLSEEAKTVDEIVRRAFASATSPDGTAWAPSALASNGKARRGRPGYRTGELFGSFSATVARKRLVIQATARYAGFFHGGTQHAPGRGMLPFTAELEPMETGPGGEWISSLEERLADYYVAEKK